MNGFLTKILRKEYFYEERSIYGKKYSRIAWIKISFPKETINPLLPMLSITKHYTAKTIEKTFHFKIPTSIFSATEMTTIKKKKNKGKQKEMKVRKDRKTTDQQIPWICIEQRRRLVRG